VGILGHYRKFPRELVIQALLSTQMGNWFKAQLAC
jgi:hypothetical protein